MLSSAVGRGLAVPMLTVLSILYVLDQAPPPLSMAASKP